jgi:uncharacterized membrane protein YfcA
MTILTYLAIGLAIGSISGVMGIGGGVLLVPALIWFCDLKPAKAAGTTLAILIPPIGLPAAWRAYRAEQVDLEAALWIAAAFTIGAYVSRGLVDYINVFYFRFAFGLLMIYVAMQFILVSDSAAANAFAGLTASLLAWLAFIGLRALGRRHMPMPNLGKQIEAKYGQGGGDIDYHI